MAKKTQSVKSVEAYGIVTPRGRLRNYAWRKFNEAYLCVARGDTMIRVRITPILPKRKATRGK